jgi:hypothetical protein
MQLVEQGKLALDEPIAGVLPELTAPQVLECFVAPTPNCISCPITATCIAVYRARCS